jgi:hypothetical protein
VALISVCRNRDGTDGPGLADVIDGDDGLVLVADRPDRPADPLDAN